VVAVAVRGLSKQFGSVRAVDGLTFEVPSREGDRLSGSQRAGKTTTLRMLLGLVRPTAGQALIGGRPYDQLPRPGRMVGAVLEAGGVHPGRRGRDHLRVGAQVIGVPDSRVDQVLEQVDLRAAAASRRVGGYSPGMRQRLALAEALLGDPQVLVLDEPGNGLDPAGMAWLRGLLRRLAGGERTVLVSSHVLAEVAQTVDHLVIVHRGRLRFAGTLPQLATSVVSVRTTQATRLRAALLRTGHQVAVTGDTTLEVRGASAEQVGRIAADQGVTLSGLTEGGTSLETAFLRLTSDDPTPPPAQTPAPLDALNGSPR
jgi:ABC-2 type transport system ATP-binding protein